MCTAPLAPGELIRVVKGPLKGLEGELVEVDGKAKVVVRLDLLGCAGVDMPVGFVEKMIRYGALKACCTRGKLTELTISPVSMKRRMV